MPIKQVKIEEKLYNSISDYCNINNLKICNFINELLKKQFMLEKYGSKPSVLQKEINVESTKKNDSIVIIDQVQEDNNESDLTIINEVKNESQNTLTSLEKDNIITQVKNNKKRKLT